MDKRETLRDLAKETMEYANSDIMMERRRLWTDSNSLIPTRPLIYIRAIPFSEFFDEKKLKHTDPVLREIEKQFYLNRYRMKLEDDYIIEPFLTVNAVLKSSPESVYGVRCSLSDKQKNGSAAFVPSIIKEEDINKIKVLDYEVDEKATNQLYELVNDAVGDIIPVDIDRQGILCRMWNNDISTMLAKMRGLEQIMWDIYDRPEWLHSLLSLMQKYILKQIDQTQQAGAFQAIDNQNQAMPYSHTTILPQANKKVDSPKDLWVHMASQEFTTIGPAAFKEFMFDYQKPIIERYGLCAYGCCEDLTQKISIIKSLKNLRRIAVSPFADVKKCAEQIGRDYVLSYRPDPASAVSFGVDEAAVRKQMQNAFDIFKQNDNRFDITLKDVETVSGDETAIIRWTKIVKEEILKAF